MGVYPVEAWYASRAGKAPINCGATVGHLRVRIVTMVDLAALGLTENDLAEGRLNTPHFDTISRQRSWMEDAASVEQIAAMQDRLQRGLDEGALGVGYGVTNFVHARFGADTELGGGVDAVQELLANAAATGAGTFFSEPALPSTGIEHVLVNGVFVVRDGEQQRGSYPGQPVRRER